jgi:hypothetical protein
VTKHFASISSGPMHLRRCAAAPVQGSEQRQACSWIRPTPQYAAASATTHSARTRTLVTASQPTASPTLFVAPHAHRTRRSSMTHHGQRRRPKKNDASTRRRLDPPVEKDWCRRCGSRRCFGGPRCARLPAAAAPRCR